MLCLPPHHGCLPPTLCFAVMLRSSNCYNHLGQYHDGLKAAALSTELDGRIWGAW